eukprot:m.201608 g.201608  ORF g.201608 m.201608 type:complete len:516 (+) comp18804_c0_seq7:138-1685(+)
MQWLFSLLAMLVCRVNSRILLNGIFNSNMVLQIDHENIPYPRIFGVGYTNETIEISGTNGFPGPFQVTPTRTGAAHWLQPMDAPWGNWSVNFTAPANRGPYTVTVKSLSNASDIYVMDNVMFGEVFFCNGQSNMELPVYSTDDKEAEYAAAVALGNRIRINFVGGNLSLDGPQISPNTGNWTVASGRNGTAVSDFSAVCWSHGRLLAEWLHTQSSGDGANTVVGLVEVSVGGTTIHHWVPTDVGTICNATGLLPSSGECVQYPPGWIYNGRMNPMLLDGHGFTARQVLYYQGEADSGENDKYTAAAYECELRGLITSYRRAFNQPLLPIVIIQLPGVTGGVGIAHDNDTALGDKMTARGWSAIQLAQRAATTGFANVGLVQVPLSRRHGHKRSHVDMGCFSRLHTRPRHSSLVSAVPLMYAGCIACVRFQTLDVVGSTTGTSSPSRSAPQTSRERLCSRTPPWTIWSPRWLEPRCRPQTRCRLTSTSTALKASCSSPHTCASPRLPSCPVRVKRL